VWGIVFDWAGGRPAARAWVEAMTPDSTRYVAIADSSGRFVIDHLPAGTYLVRGGVDANGNRTLDAREAFDSVRVGSTTAAPADSGGVELLAFVHDTVAPRIQTVAVRDSLTLRVTFDKPLAPTYALQPAAFEVVAPDSSRAAIAAVVSGVAFDSSEARASRQRADSAAQADTTRRPPPPARPNPNARRDSLRADSIRRATPRPSRPSPSPDVVLTLRAPLRPNTAYRVGVRDARSLSGYAGPSSRPVTTPKPDSAPAARPGAAPRDSARAAPLRGRPTPPAPARPTPAPPPAPPSAPATPPPADGARSRASR